MTAHPDHWTIAERCVYEFGGAAAHVRRFRRAYFFGSATYVAIVSAIAFVRSGASWDDLPVILLASLLGLFRGVGVVSLVFAWWVVKFVQDRLSALAADAWIAKEALKKPGVSFEVPYWRFLVPAAIVRYLLFGIWLGALFFLLYVFPGRFPELERFTPGSFPF